MNSAVEPPRRRMNRARYYKRVQGLLQPARLRNQRVAVVGLGSGGCRVAAELSRLGVQLLLIERPGELLLEHNIVRHLLGYPSLGKSKLTEMAAYLRSLNPSARVRVCPLDVTEEPEKLEAVLRQWRAAAIAVCTDNEPSKHAINTVALRLRIPQTGGAVYDGGIAGEVYRVEPGQACYGCITAHLQLAHRPPPPATPRDYTSLAPDAPAPTCALNLDIQQIAIIQCRMSLDLLLPPGHPGVSLPPQVNLCVFANRLVPGAFSRPLHGEFFSISRQPDCLACGDQTRTEINPQAEQILAALQTPAGLSPSAA